MEKPISKVKLASTCTIKINTDDHFTNLNGFNPTIGKAKLKLIIQRVIDKKLENNNEGFHHVIKNPLQKISLVFGKTIEGERIYIRLTNMGGFAELRLPITCLS